MKPPSLRTYRPIWSRVSTQSNTYAAPRARRIHDEKPKAVRVNEFGVPLAPTWSVRELLDSYPPPTIDDQTFDKIHRLSALVPPAKGTEEREVLKKELQELVKLVNAVRIAEVPKGQDVDIPDGRIYPVPQDVILGEEEKVVVREESAASGRELLRHSQIASETAYVLPDWSKQRTGS